jgi:hypothetical protein
LISFKYFVLISFISIILILLLVLALVGDGNADHGDCHDEPALDAVLPSSPNRQV